MNKYLITKRLITKFFLIGLIINLMTVYGSIVHKKLDALDCFENFCQQRAIFQKTIHGWREGWSGDDSSLPKEPQQWQLEYAASFCEKNMFSYHSLSLARDILDLFKGKEYVSNEMMFLLFLDSIYNKNHSQKNEAFILSNKFFDIIEFSFVKEGDEGFAEAQYNYENLKGIAASYALYTKINPGTYKNLSLNKPCFFDEVYELTHILASKKETDPKNLSDFQKDFIELFSKSFVLLKMPVLDQTQLQTAQEICIREVFKYNKTSKYDGCVDNWFQQNRECKKEIEYLRKMYDEDFQVSFNDILSLMEKKYKNIQKQKRDISKIEYFFLPNKKVKTTVIATNIHPVTGKEIKKMIERIISIKDSDFVKANYPINRKSILENIKKRESLLQADNFWKERFLSNPYFECIPAQQMYCLFKVGRINKLEFNYQPNYFTYEINDTFITPSSPENLKKN